MIWRIVLALTASYQYGPRNVTWLDPTLIAVLGAVLLTYLPGLLVGLGLRLPVMTLWGTAPLVSAALVGGSAVLAGWLGIRWSLWVVLGATLAGALVMGLCAERRC